MATEGFWFEPQTDESSYLGSYSIGSKLKNAIRIVACIYRNEENGYSVYEVEDTEHHWFKVNGYFPTPVKIDNYYEINGEVKESKFGRVVQIESYKSTLPNTEDEIIMVLRTLPRLNTKAPEVYDILGKEALSIILNEPEEVVRKIRGVGMNLALQWQQALRVLKEDDAILNTLSEYKIPPADIKRLIEKYPDIIERLRRSPYFLADEIRGFGFQQCDNIALANDYPFNGQERLEQAMLHVLKQACYRKGDCYMPGKEFIRAVRDVVDISLDFNAAVRLLEARGEDKITFGTRTIQVDKKALSAAVTRWKGESVRVPFSFTCFSINDSDLKAAMDALRGLNRIVVDKNNVYLGSIYDAELTVANCLKALVASEYSPFDNVDGVVDEVCAEMGIVLEEKQLMAVTRFCQGKGGVFILNGHAGCGKTFTLNIVMKVLNKLYEREEQSYSAKIMAPTGKAAQVAHKSTNLPAFTVHKVLHLVTDQTSESDITISGDCVVIDEFSMMGINLSATLMKAISSGVKVIIMGDFEQLPSIEAGNVLCDIIESGVVPVITLDVVKRQTAGSGILFNANEIVRGEMIRSQIVNKGKLRDNAYIYKVSDSISCRTRIVESVKALIDKGMRIDDIQVLCPQVRTDIGVDAMNYYLQEAVNPSKGEAEVLSKSIKVHVRNGQLDRINLMFRAGDKVIHTVNNYGMIFYRYEKGAGFVMTYDRLGIMNGETGRIAQIIETQSGKKKSTRIYVRYGKDRYAMYEDDWSELSHAYAMTIHRAQGSQWPAVLAPIMMVNKTMLSRKLLYTLYTRAQAVSMLFGTEDAIAYAINNNASAKRRTGLIEKLREK